LLDWQDIAGFDKPDFHGVTQFISTNARPEILNGYHMLAYPPGIDDITTI
jgi:hypothetical protein